MYIIENWTSHKSEKKDTHGHQKKFKRISYAQSINNVK